MKINHFMIIVFACANLCSYHMQALAGEPSLKSILGNKFLVGVAVNSEQASGQDAKAADIIKQHFNSIVAENCMKCEVIHPEENRYNFTLADEFVKFGEENGMFITGHCLIWHSQLAPWFCVDKTGKNVSPEVLKERMKKHIHTIVSRYKGQIKGWDVVNEAIMEDGSWRKTKFYEILGEEYIPLAFQYAHEADPKAELYYNDYGMSAPGRREAVVKLVNSLKEKGIRIDAVGMQGHMGMDYPDIKEFEKSILAFGSTGVKVMITEWDMSALPTVQQGANISDTVAYQQMLNPYPVSLPDSVSRVWNNRMGAFLNLFIKHADIISRVTAWGVSDSDSWKNNWPMKGRREYPLLFDRNYQPKPFLKEVLSPKTAIFDEFVYSVNPVEKTEESPTNNSPVISGRTILNPILSGCYPDPSICRAGNDYYLVNSSFAYYPGVPIWHSTDLISWEQLGYVLNRPSQLQLNDGLRISQGIYAPDIQYNPHNRLFYMITTGVGCGGNFYVTTDNPRKGNWSDPVFLPKVGGIDPSLFFDTDGKAYIVNNDAPAGTPEYDGHRAIWIHEFDWRNNRVTGESKVIVNGGVDLSKKPIWIEGPHLYKVNNTYYLMAAEGGTGPEHSEVIFSADSPIGPFKPCAINPILSQRDLAADRPNPVTCAGHADLVQTPEGDWYAVFLAVRPYRDEHDVMGRETFLLPVSWSEGQPVILPKEKTITYATDRKYPPTPLWTAEGLSREAFFIRTPQTPFYKIDKTGKLTLDARSARLNDWKQPSAIGRWITDWHFIAQTALSFTPVAPNDFAGIICFHNDDCYIRFGKTINEQNQEVLLLETYSLGKLCRQTTYPLPQTNGKVYLKIEGDKVVNYTFSYSSDPGKGWNQIGEPVSADLLSTRTAGGFTGTMVGIYATGKYDK